MIYSPGKTELSFSLVGRGRCKRWLRLCRGVRHPTSNECPVYDTKPSDGEAAVLAFLEYSFFTLTPRSTLIRGGSTY